MRYRREPTTDHFWSGFVVGAARGGVVGVVLATELGRRAHERLETAVVDVRSRLTGVAETPDLEVEEAEEAEEESSS